MSMGLMGLLWVLLLSPLVRVLQAVKPELQGETQAQGTRFWE